MATLENNLNISRCNFFVDYSLVSQNYGKLHTKLWSKTHQSFAIFRKGLISAIAAVGILAGCANFKEGEIVAKKYEAPKQGTPLFGYTSPAVFTASVVLKLATMRAERFDNYVERYDFENRKFVGEAINDRAAYNISRVGDWLIHTNQKDKYQEIRDFSRTIEYPAGTSFNPR